MTGYYDSDDSTFDYGSDQYLSDEEEDYVYPWPTSTDDSWASISSEEAIQKILLKLPTYDPPDSDEGGNELPDPSAGLDREDSIIEHASDEIAAADEAGAADGDGAEKNAELASMGADGRNLRKIETGKNGPKMDQFLELYEGFRMLVHPDDVAEFDGYIEEAGPDDDMEKEELTSRPSSRSRTASLMIDTAPPATLAATATAGAGGAPPSVTGSVASLSPSIPEASESPVETPITEDMIPLKKQLEEQQAQAKAARAKKKRERAESRAKKPRKKEQFKIGDTVAVTDVGRGVIRWFGKAKVGEASKKLIGVELNEPVGDSNGILEGTAYFKCKAKRGMFVKPSRVRKVHVRHVKVAKENRGRKDARLFGDFYDNLMTDRIRRRRGRTDEVVPTKLGPREIGRVKGWKGGDEEYKDVLKIAAKGDFLDDRTSVRPKQATTPVAKKSGPRDVGVAKGYEMPDFKITDDGGDFLEERTVSRKKKKSLDESGPVKKKLGPRDYTHSKKYKAPDYKIDDSDDFLSARTGRKSSSASSQKVERKPGPRDVWLESRQSQSRSSKKLLSEDDGSPAAVGSGSSSSSARRSSGRRKKSTVSRSRDSSPVGGFDDDLSFDMPATLKRTSSKRGSGSMKKSTLSTKRSSGSDGGSSRKKSRSSSAMGDVQRSSVRKSSAAGSDGGSSSSSRKKKRELTATKSATDLLASGSELPELSESGSAGSGSKKKRSSRSSKGSGGSSLAKPKRKRSTAKSVG